MIVTGVTPIYSLYIFKYEFARKCLNMGISLYYTNIPNIKRSNHIVSASPHIRIDDVNHDNNNSIHNVIHICTILETPDETSNYYLSIGPTFTHSRRLRLRDYCGLCMNRQWCVFNSCDEKYWSQAELRCVDDMPADCTSEQDADDPSAVAAAPSALESPASSGGDVAIPIAADEPIVQPVAVEDGEPTEQSPTKASGTVCN